MDLSKRIRTVIFNLFSSYPLTTSLLFYVLRLCAYLCLKPFSNLPPPKKGRMQWRRVPWAREQVYLQEKMTNANVLLVKSSSTQHTVSRTILCFCKYQSIALSSVYLTAQSSLR